ncbi:MAG: hypothetical protein KC591_03355, partial [Gemmatimonadetes bacterium]|nr:hypothetical protein [Gemmatimonadota bacterium]
MQPSIPRIVSSALVLGLAGPAPAGATVYTVPSPGTPTIASAFALATGDDLVEVLPGTYAEHDLNVTCSIRGTGGADQTIVDAERLGQVFRLTSGSDLSIEGLTLRNGLGDAGGAIEQQSPQNLVVRDCVFEANEAAFGGAIYTVDFTDYPVQVIGVRFEGNQA